MEIRFWVALIAAVSSFIPLATIAGEISKSRIDRWEPGIREFERLDAEKPPQPGGVVFVGSSSIRRWDLAKSFGKDSVLNRGFGGSRIADVNHFADRLVLKHKPRMVVFYAGDNDIAAGVSAKEVSDDFARFCKAMQAELPTVKIMFISIKPSPKRWVLADEQRAANDLVRRQCEADDRLVYLNLWTPMLDMNGRPRRELFAKDMLHLNDAGYELWADRVKPLLVK